MWGWGSASRQCSSEQLGAAGRKLLRLDGSVGAPSMAPLPLLPLLLALTLPGAPATQEVQQSPRYAIAPEGGSVSITCRTHGTLRGIYLERGQPPRKVVYYEEGKEPTVDEEFWDRAAFSGPQHNLTVTLGRLRLADTGNYTCQAIMEDSVWGAGTLVLVADDLAHQEAPHTSLTLLAALAVGSFLAGLGLGLASALSGLQIRKLCSGKNKSSVGVIYEDMSYSRSCALAVPNQYL